MQHQPLKRQSQLQQTIFFFFIFERKRVYFQIIHINVQLFY